MLYSSSPSTDPRRPARFLLLSALLLVTSACQEKTPIIVTRFAAFGGQVDVNLVGVDKEQARLATAMIREDFAYLQRDLDATPNGSLARVNRLLASGETFVPPPSMFPLLASCRVLETSSEGRFAPASGQLTELWGRDRTTAAARTPPSADQIASLLAARPSLTQIEQQGLTLRGTNPVVQLDFRGIASSYAIDLAVQHLLDLGIRNALLQVGSALRVLGDRSGQPWRVPILRASGSGVYAILAVRNRESVATVADYDENVIDRGALYHAIIDPRTGAPARESRAVTVVHEDTVTATAAALALFSAGPGDWERIAGKMGVRFVLLLDRRGGTHMSPAMAGRIELVDAQDDLSPSASTPGPPGRPETGP